jgi:hypothetical protein
MATIASTSTAMIQTVELLDAAFLPLAGVAAIGVEAAVVDVAPGRALGGAVATASDVGVVLSPAWPGAGVSAGCTCVLLGWQSVPSAAAAPSAYWLLCGVLSTSSMV